MRKRSLSPLEKAALQIRNNAARTLIERGDITGQDALLYVLMPSPAVLQASFEQARAEREERGRR